MKKYKINVVYLEILCSFVLALIFWMPLFNDPARFLLGDFDFFITYLFADKVSLLYFKEFPFFSSYIGGGFPLWANPQNMLFSIPQIFSCIFANQWIAIRVSVLFISAIGMVGVFVLLRQLDIKNFFCRLYGAVIYTFSGFLVSHLTAGHFNFHNMAYLPILSAAFVWSWKSEKFSYAIPFILSAMVYAGASVTNIFIAIFLMSFLLFYDLKKWCAYILFGILLSLPKLVASYKILSVFPKNCTMGKVSESFAGIWHTLITALFGLGQKWDYSPYNIPGPGVHEINGYIGILSFIFAILGGYYLLKSRNYRYGKFALSMAVVAVTAIFLYPGDSNPVWPLLSKNLILGALHMPTRFIGLLSLPIAYFASVGLSYSFKRRFSDRWKNIFFIAICLFTFAEYNFVNRRNILLIRRFTFIKSPPHFYINKEFRHSRGPEWECGTIVDETQLMSSYIQNNEGILRFYDTLLGYSGSAFPRRSSVKEGKSDIFNADPNVEIKWVSPSKILVSVCKIRNGLLEIPVNVNYFPGWKIISKQPGAGCNSAWSSDKWGLLTLYLDENFPLKDRRVVALKYCPGWEIKTGFVIAGLSGLLLIFLKFFWKKSDEKI